MPKTAYLTPAQLAELMDVADLPLRTFSKVRGWSLAHCYRKSAEQQITLYKDGYHTRVAETPRQSIERARRPFVGGRSAIKSRSAQADT